MIVRYYSVYATAPNPAATGDHDSVVFGYWTIPDFWYNTVVKQGGLGVVLRWELTDLQAQLVELGVDPRTITWEASLSVPYDTDELRSNDDDD